MTDSMIRQSRFLFILLLLLSVVSACESESEQTDNAEYTWHKVVDPLSPPPQYVAWSSTFDTSRNRLVSVSCRPFETFEFYESTWHYIETNYPLQRAEAVTVCYNQEENAVILFGYKGPSYEEQAFTWRYQEGQWSDITPALQPSVRVSPAVCYDFERNCIVLFGGEWGVYYDDTWEWKRGIWSPINPPNHPSKRMMAALGYDPGTHRDILFGGATDGILPAQTWSYDGITWTEVNCPNTPSKRISCYLSTDFQAGNVVLFGGKKDLSGNITELDFWRFDGAGWNLEHQYDSSEPLGLGGFWHDPTDNGFYYFSNESGNGWVRTGVFRLEQTEMVRITPGQSPLAFSSAMVYDAIRRRMVLFSYHDMAFENTFWGYRDGGWEMLFEFPSSEEYSDRFFLDYDQQRGKVLFFLSRPYSEDSQWLEFYELDEEGWEQREFSTFPKTRYDQAHAYDPKKKVLVFFGGRFSGSTCSDETWMFDGATWEQVFPHRSPPARQGAVMAWDEKMEKLVLFGGRQDYDYYNDTWMLDDQTWRRIDTGDAPPVTGTMFYHRGLGRMMMIITTGGYYTPAQTVWTFDGQNWTLEGSPAELAERGSPSAAYDPDRDAVVLYGGEYRDADHNLYYYCDTWEFGK